MKSLVIASFLFVTAGAATASPPPRSIKVSAQASERIVPDRVLWRLVLNARHRDLTKAKAASDRQIRDVLATTRRLGVQPSDVQTGELSIDKEYSDRYSSIKGGRKFVAYVLSRTVVVRQRAPKRFDDFFTGFIKNRDMRVDYELASSKAANLKAKAQVNAVIAARAKARAMVEALGAKLGRVMQIDEGYRPSHRRRGHNLAMGTLDGSASEGSTFAPGTIEFSSAVTVEFAIE